MIIQNILFYNFGAMLHTADSVQDLSTVQFLSSIFLPELLFENYSKRVPNSYQIYKNNIIWISKLKQLKPNANKNLETIKNCIRLKEQNPSMKKH